MEDKIFDIVTDLIRDDITKDEAIDKLFVLHNVIQAKQTCCPKCGCNKMTGDGSAAWCLNELCDFVTIDC